MILHPQLKKDCFILGRFELSLLLLLNDSQYPWFILVPQREGLREIHELSPQDQQTFIQESSLLSQTIQNLFSAEKMNVAAIGNMVPQLHVHHIARFSHDKAWPKPVWGAFPAVPYSDEQVETITAKVRAALPTLQQVSE